MAGGAGKFVQQPAGYWTFVPPPVMPAPAVAYEAELLGLLSQADQAVGRLDGLAELLPNPDLFVAMYVRREAVLSSQIEGTQSTLEDLLNYELGPVTGLPADVKEVVNYVAALDHGLARLSQLPPSRRLIREVHAKLLASGRGAGQRPGEFRTTQNWMGGASTRIEDASFVPPAVPDMERALDDFERFLNEEQELPVLVHAGIPHAQFETIHPFLDGNGRVGRLLIILLLVHRGVLHKPLLYLSHYLKRRRAEYYDELSAVRETGSWEAWLRFFLRGVAETSNEATGLARELVALRERDRAKLVAAGLGGRAFETLELLFEWPVVNVNFVAERLGVSFSGATRLVDRLAAVGILSETTGQARNRRFAYQEYLGLLRT